MGQLKNHHNNPRYNEILKQHQETFRWLWKPIHNVGPGFIEWLADGQGTFWISGKPGSGKSALFAIIYR
jgi:hypothetical protein